MGHFHQVGEEPGLKAVQGGCHHELLRQSIPARDCWGSGIASGQSAGLVL